MNCLCLANSQVDNETHGQSEEFFFRFVNTNANALSLKGDFQKIILFIKRISAPPYGHAILQ